jgi:hypothetical protein
MPELDRHLRFTWQAFWDLSNDRPAVFGGIGGIPFSAIDRYAKRYDITDVDEFDRFARLLKAMDTVFQTHVMECAKEEQHGNNH